MVARDFAQITVSDADQTDYPAIADVYCAASLLRDYLRLAQESRLRCLVLRRDQEIIGFGLLVFRRPEFWPSAGDQWRLPEIVGLSVNRSQRSKGFGSVFMSVIETEAAKAGYDRLYLTVDPVNNPRAYAFYQRRNYQALQTQPYRAIWEFKDSQQNLHQSEDWLIDMMKCL